MAKIKTVFVCNECGYESAKWLGKCPRLWSLEHVCRRKSCKKYRFKSYAC